MRLTVQPLQWISAGLLCATATGMAAWLFGYPFLSTHFRYLDLPIIGAIPMASALLFDIGVFAVVVGTTALILVALAHQSIRSPRAAKPSQDVGEGADCWRTWSRSPPAYSRRRGCGRFS